MKDDSGELKPASESASEFLKSISFLIEDNTVVIDDWIRDGAECSDPNSLLNRGVCFLKILEDKRSLNEDAKPTNIVKVSKIVIKAKSKSGKDLCLMKLNEKSHRLQFIGGTVRKQENYETTLRREMNEEIPKVHLAHKRDYTYSKITSEPLGISFVSPSYGSYRKYMIQYYHLDVNKEVDFHGSLRWVSVDEIENGQTDNGVKTVPPPNLFKSHLSEKVRQLPVSINKRIKYNPKSDSLGYAEKAKKDIDPEGVKIYSVLKSLTFGQAASIISFIIFLIGAFSGAGIYIGQVLANGGG